jgi:hypothetical protein
VSLPRGSVTHESATRKSATRKSATRKSATRATVGCAVVWLLVALGPSPARAQSIPAAAQRGLDVLPFPGTPDAAPSTQIDFPALEPGMIASLAVRGSRSGPHRGMLRAVPGGPGSEFLAARSFDPGERVSVLARLRSVAAGAAAGAPGSRVLRFSFTVERPASPLRPARTSAPGQLAPRSSMVTAPPLTQSFASAPQLHPPVVTISGSDTDTAAGDIFLDAQNSGQNGPYMLDPEGQLLWELPTPSTQAAIDVQVQSYDHQPVITYYQGPISPPGLGDGVGVMLDESYERIHTITAGAGYQRDGIDLHELTLTPQGDAFVTVVVPIRANLSSIGGPRRGVLLDSVIEEIRVSDNRTLWQWSAYGHIPLRDVHAGRPQAGVPYDAYHVNSVQPLPDGELILSSRYTWAVYAIDMRSGRIDWELGGRHSSFRMGPGTNFEWQHDAVMHSGGLLSVFDDGAGLYRSEPQSRALQIQLGRRRATLVRADQHSPPVLATSQGSVQLLFNRNVFVDWGSAGTFSEYAPSGAQLFSGSFRGEVQSYRSFRYNDWVGHPLAPPSIATRPAGIGAVNVYASWDGATQVASWRVLAGPSRALLVPAASAPWRNFETRILVRTAMPYLEVEALDSSGRVLGSSGVAAASGACVGAFC